ncbi:unnamed protein product [Sphenostylis stenocarpa]|uniref:Uncharacterized protein n=1 Tax=Sphenostylis stenocarpa TaxID=92480 RepID=A0AA86SRY9_9FABA|nr:unnamed protein product [Sphenostylis stenocarpa]
MCSQQQQMQNSGGGGGGGSGSMNIPVSEVFWTLVDKADKKFSKIRDLPFYQRSRTRFDECVLYDDEFLGELLGRISGACYLGSGE